MSAANATFDQIVDSYERDPLAFIEELFRKWRWRYEITIGDECVSCASWDKLTKTKPRHVTTKDHARLGILPFPHKFDPITPSCPSSS